MSPEVKHIATTFLTCDYLHLQEVTRFYLSGGKDVVTMQTLLMDDSVTLQSFDLSQWIKVTSLSRGNK